ncbi:Amt family ammonium transporter [Breznakibacter xylanolyticus]|uniref:Ammonium transporter n=1 Tax=Breznakibacter xylanolyticus TaxID=990 RepID=A0A2W7NAI2_9BACT|nr:ammonium transporter [Breznakibacter xylanolyticus]PZX17455.1 Amt family ammonium transporter [Breznakibacter xylanolyticus]
METVDITTVLAETAFSVDTLWVLIAAILVFFMQAGFALVEAGFTRAKNTVNILMKNLMDFSIGSITFFILGFGIMFGEDIAGFIGTPDLFFSGGFEGGVPGLAFLFFQTVFAATAATIVSGAMAERTHFISYLVFSFIITLVIYPISGHWIWGGGWLSQLEIPFHDFAGSTVVHSLGGWLGLMGALILGPRIGKFNGKTNAIPGHNLTLAALGVFILWMGWFGFNPGSQLAAHGTDNANAIALIFMTTNIAAAGGTVGTLITAWLRFGKPSLSLTLNGSLAGLVAITAGCDVVSPAGALLIGLMAGVLLVFAVSFIENTLKIDDPVGASSVHGICGAFGTLMVGFFSTSEGLFYGHGIGSLISQLIGVGAVAAWGLGTGFILFTALKKTIGLRVDKRVETEGLDIYEHGENAYN